MVQMGQYPDAFYRVTAKAVIRKDDKVLVVWDKGGFWNLPGGGIDHGESVESALERELFEELGYSGKFTTAYRDTLTYYSNSLQYACMHLIFDVTLENYQDTVGEDAEKAVFIDPATLKNSDHIAHQFIYKYSVDETVDIPFAA
ncbi:MAG: NUDIX domain-containing protein [Candidatus Saccharimonas sp.]